MSKQTMKWLTFLPLMILSTENASANLDSLRMRQIEALEVNRGAITVDGKITEEVWQRAQWQSNFIQRNPRDGLPASFKTEFSVAFDEEHLYVAARAYDPEPDKIKAILTRRDNYTQSDWLYVSIDSYHDNRTAFEFGLNAAGVKHDLRRFDDNNMDDDWDAVWDGRVNIDEKGWTAEWCIPFRELRFNSAEELQWGLQVYRELPRLNNELAVWNYWSQSEQGFVSRYGVLRGLKHIKVSRPLYFMPYVANQVKHSANLATPIDKSKYDVLFNMGGDLRYTSSKGLTYNLTINPDFGQVEADPADFNLTEYETYFGERRPFFIEGANIFRYQLGVGDGDGSANTLFYTRRIGRIPTNQPYSDENKEVVTTFRPENTSIFGALKVTGRIANGLSIGLMDALTSEEKGTVYYSDKTKDVSVVEPMTNYWVGRLQQDFNNGQTTIGGILTAVNRRLNDNLLYMHKAAYTGGIDINHEFLQRQFTFNGAVAFSNVQGDTLAIQRTQKSPTHYFQRVDADYLEYNPQATSLSGSYWRGFISKNTGHIRGAVGCIAYNPGFEVNDLGFNNQADRINQFTWLQYRQWEKGRLFRQYTINLNQWATWNYGGERINLGGNINMHFTFNNNWSTGFGFNRNLGGYDPSINRGGPAIYSDKNYSIWTYVNSDARQAIYSGLFASYYQSRDGVLSYQIQPEITWRPRQNVQLTAQINYNHLNDTWAWIGKALDENNEYRYIWSKLHRNLLSLTLRSDVTLTPNLTIQYYAQPFFTAGNYFDLMELVAPRSKNYEQRFRQFGEQIKLNPETGKYEVDKNLDGMSEYTFRGQTDFNYKQFRSNLVLRWEYQTGSTLYLVWSQGFTDYEPMQPFDLKRDFGHLFQTNGDNVLMIKVSQLISL